MQAGQRARGAASLLGGRVLASADHRALFGSAVLIGFLTLGVKVIALLKDIVVASRFGTTDANDAFVTSWALPGFIAGVLSGAFAGAFIPVIIDARTKSDTRRYEAVIGEAMTISGAVFLVTSVLMFLGHRTLMPLVAQGYSEPKFETAIQLSFIMIPAILIGGMSTMWSSLLHAEHRFGLVAAAPAAVPIVSIAMLIIWPSAGISALAAGFVIGMAIQAAVVFLGLQQRGISMRFAWHGYLPETRRMLGQVGTLSINAIVFSGLGVVDTAMAATLGPGSQSVLLYANKLIIPVMAISSTAIGTAVLPYFSRLVAEEDWDGLRHTLNTFVKLILAFGIPAAAVLIVAAKPIVSLLFERGQFNAEDSDAVARVLATYALLIPIETVAVLLSRVLVSLQQGKLLAIAAVAIFAFNIAADWVLKGIWGVEGIAMATVANQAFSLLFLVIVWRRLLVKKWAQT